jgi:hypothetical protein
VLFLSLHRLFRLKIKNTVLFEEDIKFSDETVEDVVGWSLK